MRHNLLRANRAPPHHNQRRRQVIAGHLRIRQPDHHRLADPGQLDDQRLQLGRSDLEVAVANHRLAAVRNVQEAIGVEAANVARLDEAVRREEGSRFLRVGVVADEAVRVRRLDFTLLVGAEDAGAVFGDDLREREEDRFGMIINRRCAFRSANRFVYCSVILILFILNCTIN